MRAFWLAALVVACGSGQPTTPAPKLKIFSDAPAQGAALMQEQVQVSGTLSALGTTHAGDLALVAGGLVYERAGGVLTLRNLYAEGADPTSLGAVSAIIPRAQAGAWLAAE